MCIVTTLIKKLKPALNITSNFKSVTQFIIYGSLIAVVDGVMCFLDS